MNKVSVIMPVYNVEKFVADSIISVLNQTFQNFELIIINDGSTDNSENIINKFKDNEKVKIFNIKNSGLAAARNFGLKFVTGNYIYFIDSDDIIPNNFFEINLNILKFFKADIVSFDYTEVSENFKLKNLRSYEVEKKIKLTSNESLELLMKNNINQMAWSYIVKAEIILDNKLKFSPGRLFEDNNFAAKLFSKSGNIVKVKSKQPAYYLRNRVGSITDISNSKISENALNDELFIFKDEYNVFLNSMPQKTKFIEIWYFNKIVHLMVKYQKIINSNLELSNYLNEDINKRYKRFNRFLTVKDKIRYFRVRYKIIDSLIRIIIDKKIFIIGRR